MGRVTSSVCHLHRTTLAKILTCWISGCGTRFVDLVKGYHVMVGYDNLIFGSGVPGVGRDGVTAGDPRLTTKKKMEVEQKVKDERGGCGTVDILSAAVP
jgi:hypothetical protein